MRRDVLVSADLTGDAIDELKQWLGIKRDDEDANLTALLKASLDMCEGFVGQRPLSATCEETVTLSGGVAALTSRPITFVDEVDSVDSSGERALLAEADYSVQISAEGEATVQLENAGVGDAVVVRYTAGIANTWAQLPGALRHGIIRLAAFLYRERDGAKAMPPPASVTALWRPWRLVRLT